jgi:hypothetical protein
MVPAVLVTDVVLLAFMSLSFTVVVQLAGDGVAVDVPVGPNVDGVGPTGVFARLVWDLAGVHDGRVLGMGMGMGMAGLWGESGHRGGCSGSAGAGPERVDQVWSCSGWRWSCSAARG